MALNAEFFKSIVWKAVGAIMYEYYPKQYVMYIKYSCNFFVCKSDVSTGSRHKMAEFVVVNLNLTEILSILCGALTDF